MQKAYTTPHFLVLGLRFPGKNIVLYIGRGNQYEGLFISSKFPPSYLRVQDRLLDYVRKYLVGARLGKMEIDSEHFLALFHFKNEHSDNAIVFGYKDRQLFFIRQSKEEIYSSWNGETSENKTIPVIIDSFLGKRSLALAGSPSSWSLEDYLEEEKKKINGKPLQKKKEKFLLRKVQNITNDLLDVMKWKIMEEDLLNERIDMTPVQIILYGHKIKFAAGLNSWQKRDAVFVKIKKLKKAEEILKLRNTEAKEELARVQVGDFEFEVTKEKIIAPLWQTAPSTHKKMQSDYNVKYFKIKTISGIIALDAESNDWLRNQGNKEHYWFHIENYPGAHCLVKADDLSLLGVVELSAIASLLRDHSQLEILEIPVIYSQLKHVKGLKGTKGKVLVKKPKYLRCNYSSWKEIISIL